MFAFSTDIIFKTLNTVVDLTKDGDGAVSFYDLVHIGDAGSTDIGFTSTFNTSIDIAREGTKRSIGRGNSISFASIPFSTEFNYTVESAFSSFLLTRYPSMQVTQTSASLQVAQFLTSHETHIFLSSLGLKRGLWHCSHLSLKSQWSHPGI